VFLRHSARGAGEMYRYRPTWDAPFAADAA